MNLIQTEPLTITLIKENAGERWVFTALELLFETRLHQEYKIIITVISNASLEAFSLTTDFNVGDWYSVEVNFLARQQVMYLQGLCTELVATGQYHNNQELHTLTLSSELFPLFNNRRCGVYYGGNVLDVINKGLIEVTTKFKLAQHTSFEKKIMQPINIAYPKQLSLTQYLEADMAFILRQLRQSGVWLNFYHHFTNPDDLELKSAPKVNLTLGDHNAAFRRYPHAVKILSKAQHLGMGIYEITYHAEGTALGSVEGIYQDEITGQTLSHQAKITASLGKQIFKYTLPHTALTQAQVQYQAQVVAESLSLRQKTCSGYFQGLNIQAGYIIEVQDKNLELSQEYILQEVRYHFYQSTVREGSITLYQQKHSFKAYPLQVPYRELLIDAQGQEPELYQSPKYRGVMSGVFALTKGQHTVMPDRLGNIPLWFPYQYWYACQEQPCRYTRVLSPASQGGRAGVSFPYYQDTEFVLMFIDGHLDRPVIKGTVANHLTGHLHSQNIQKRSALVLPQGQHLVYSNTPGNQNFLKYGTTHNEGADDTYVLLSNYQNKEQPGTKKLDHQQFSTQNYERVVIGHVHQQSASLNNKEMAQQEGPKTYLLIQLCDQSNHKKPQAKAILKNYLSAINADFIFTDQIGATHTLQRQINTSKSNHTFKVLLAAHVGAIDLKNIEVALTHASPENPEIAINIIALNARPLLPHRRVKLESQVWQENQANDAQGNLYYTVYLTILAPPCMLNFRHDFYAAQHKLPQEDEEIYSCLQPLFVSTTNTFFCHTELTQEKLNFYKAQGNNVLIFIHGFSVTTGNYPVDFVQVADKSIRPSGYFTLYRSAAFIKQRYQGDEAAELLASKQRYGTGACRWQIAMEYNLNRAFGFDDQDYAKYTRIINVIWQGDPASPANYMAAIPMSEFPARQLFKVIQQLHNAKIAIELMAHSLGNALLARVLDLCAQAKIKIKHAHLWQPALPETALADNAQQYLPVLLWDAEKNKIKLPCAYDYLHAHEGAEAITVLFSKQDTILGPLPEALVRNKLNLLKDRAQDKISFLQTSFLYACDPSLWVSELWLKENAASNITLWRTIQDPGAGWSFAIPAAIIRFMDQQVLRLAAIHQRMLSIYHLANLYRYPLDCLLHGSAADLASYYQHWQEMFINIEVDNSDGHNTSTVAMKATLEQQARFLHKLHPQLLTFAVILLKGYYAVTYGSARATTLVDLESEQHQATAKTHLIGLLTEDYPILYGLNWKQISNPLAAPSKQTILVATLLITCLMTPAAVPRAALGYTPASKIFTKNIYALDQGIALTDHNGMLFPNSNMAQEIYHDKLCAGGHHFAIDHFGTWRT
jgi:uncharacterized protein involved in type VI secretion and phage assembly